MGHGLDVGLSEIGNLERCVIVDQKDMTNGTLCSFVSMPIMGVQAVTSTSLSLFTKSKTSQGPARLTLEG